MKDMEWEWCSRVKLTFRIEVGKLLVGGTALFSGPNRNSAANGDAALGK